MGLQTKEKTRNLIPLVWRAWAGTWPTGEVEGFTSETTWNMCNTVRNLAHISMEYNEFISFAKPPLTLHIIILFYLP